MKTYFASCPKRSELFLIEELESFGVQDIEKKNGGVQFRTTPLKALEVLFETRIASRLFLLLDVYPIKGERDLYEKVTRKWWHQIFDHDQTFKIQTLFDSDANRYFKNSMMFSLKVKDAIVDEFRKETGKRPDVDTTNPDISLLVRVESRGRESGFNSKFFLDLTNTPLSDRGYRRGRHKAPLRENLAAALVHIANWKPENGPLYDLFCGSGTILIEAAQKALGLPPTYLKIKRANRGRTSEFSFLNHNWFKESPELHEFVRNYFETTLQKGQKALESKSLPIFGSDIDITTARENIKAAGLEKHIKLIPLDFMKIKPAKKGSILISNPPYGERLESGEELYYQIGNTLKNSFSGCDAYIFTSEEALRKKIFLKPTQRYPLFNGPLDCRLNHYQVH